MKNLLKAILIILIFNSCKGKLVNYPIDESNNNGSSVLLSSISISNISFSFDANIFEYILEVPFFIQEININVVPVSNIAKVYINQEEGRSLNNYSITDTASYIEITVNNNNKEKTYSIELETTDNISIDQYIKEEPTPVENSIFGVKMSASNGKIFVASRKLEKVYIYKNVANSFELIQTIDSPINIEKYDFASAIYAHKDKFIVSATLNTGGSFAKGYLYIYKENENNFYELIQETSVNNTFIYFAGSEHMTDGLKMSDNIIVVSEPKPYGSSKVHILEKIDGTWQKVKTIESTLDSLGKSISISDDEKTIAISQPIVIGTEDKIHIYEKVNNNWIEVQTLSSENGGNNLGSSIEFSNNKLAVTELCGANNTNIYEKQNNTWIKTHTIFQGGSDLFFNDNLLIIGQGYSNSVQIFSFTDNDWEHVQTILPQNSNTCDNFGEVVYYLDNKIIISSSGEDSDGLDQSNNNLENSGAIFIYK